MEATIRCRWRIARRTNDPRCATSGLPLFSRSSSILSDGNMVAHAAGRLFLRANDSAEFSSRKIPPIRPRASRATQKPSLLGPIKKAGIASLTMPGSSGRNCGATAACSSAGKVPERSASRSIVGVERVGVRRIGSGLVSCTAIIGSFTTMTSPELPHTNVRGLSYCPSHPVTDIGIEHFAKSDENSFELFANAFRLMRGIESDCGHRGSLTNLTAMMCRRRHRKARWLGVWFHRRDIRMPGTR